MSAPRLRSGQAPTADRTVAVFGSSEPLPGSTPYELARALGGELARAGFVLLTGGYGGVMEAASLGAREAGGRTVGVTCASFGPRVPNRHLDERRDSADLFDRLRELIAGAAGFVVLPGKSGTLSELTTLWALHRAGCLDRRPVVLLGDGWGRLLEVLGETGMLDAAQRDLTRLAATPREATRLLQQALAAASPETER